MAGMRDDVCFGSPHLHFQAMDRPSILFADGLPYVFDAFVLAGLTPPLAQTLRYFDAPVPVPITTDEAGPRRNALPMGRDVVTFLVRPWPQVRQDHHNRAASRE